MMFGRHLADVIVKLYDNYIFGLHLDLQLRLPDVSRGSPSILKQSLYNLVIFLTTIKRFPKQPVQVDNNYLMCLFLRVGI